MGWLIRLCDKTVPLSPEMYVLRVYISLTRSLDSVASSMEASTSGVRSGMDCRNDKKPVLF